MGELSGEVTSLVLAIPALNVTGSGPLYRITKFGYWVVNELVSAHKSTMRKRYQSLKEEASINRNCQSLKEEFKH